MQELKICRNCKWHFVAMDDRCSNFKTSSVNLVTGEKTYPSCYSLREDHWPAMQDPEYCGSEGKNYEPKHSR